jgi:hypothetical protein
MKQQDLNRMAIFLGKKLPIPQQEHIADTIRKIESRLVEKKINKFVNASVKEGYTKALEILRNNDVSFSRYNELKTAQSKAIAAIAVDYLKGDCAQEVLCNIPLK